MIYETNKSFICKINNKKYIYGKKIYGKYAKKMAEKSENENRLIKNFIIEDRDNNIAIIKIYSKTIGYNNVIIDLEDINKIENYKWRVKKDKKHNTMYCLSDIVINKKHKSLNIHRIIMNCPEDKIIDHIDRNGLNNRKNNLRIVDISTNGKNSRKQKNNKSNLPTGVYYNEKENCFRVFWSENKKSYGRTLYIKKHGGYRKTKIKAILLRKSKCEKNGYDMKDIEEAIKKLTLKIKIRKLL